MQKQNNTAAKNAPRTIDVGRKHTVGQFVTANPEAKRVLHAHRKEAQGMFSIESRATFHAA